MLGNFGMIPWILTIIPVRENSEVVIIYPDKHHNNIIYIYIHICTGISHLLIVIWFIYNYDYPRVTWYSY